MKPKKLGKQFHLHRSEEFAKKMTQDFDRANPSTICQMVQKHRVSGYMIFEIIDQDCNANSGHKFKLNALSNRLALQLMKGSSRRVCGTLPHELSENSIFSSFFNLIAFGPNISRKKFTEN
jgi:hypothetical protein